MKVFCFIFTFGLVIYPFSVQALRIQSLKVKGHKIVSLSAVMGKIESRPRQNYRVKKVRKDVQNLFNTGWFKHIEVQMEKTGRNSVSLTYIVKEQPIVKEVIYEGNRKLSKKDLDKILNFSAHEFLNHKKIRKSIQSIKEEYEKKGFYLAEVSHSLKTGTDDGLVSLVIKIKENQKVRVKKILFAGNNSISSEELKSFMSTKEKGFFSFLSGSGSYSRENLDKDINNIQYIYLDKGYWQAVIHPPQVFISPDKRDIFVHIRVEEGARHRAGSINFKGDLIFNQSFLKEGLETKESEVFSYGKLQRDIRNIETKYGNKGYAFVNISPQFFKPPGQEPVLHILFDIQKGKQVSVRRINILGNDYTRDKVIRREMKIFEGDLYNADNKDKSNANIQRLGFFDDVKVMTKTLKNKDDEIDLEVTVSERENTGFLQGGLGYNGYSGFELQGRLHKTNLLGRGYNVGLDAEWNSFRQRISFNFSDPYFLDSRWHLGGELYLDYWDDTPIDIFRDCKEYKNIQKKYKGNIPKPGGLGNVFKSSAQTAEEKQKLEELQRAQSQCLLSLPGVHYRGFSEQKLSGGFTFGRSVGDYLKLSLYYRLEDIKLFNTIDKELFPVEQASGLRNPLEGIVEYDKRNDRLFPTAGLYSKASLAYNGFFGKFNYLSLSGNFRWYQKLLWNVIFRVNTQYSQHVNLSESGKAPFDQLFLLGGMHSLRGFEYFSVGPRRTSRLILTEAQNAGHENAEGLAQRPYGGMREFYTNLELQFPLLSGRRAQGVLFIDAGSAYTGPSSFWPQFRSNWGAGLRLFTPMGPIRLEMGFPFKPQLERGEARSQFNFTMGFSF